jgi:hypothetical protein
MAAKDWLFQSGRTALLVASGNPYLTKHNTFDTVLAVCAVIGGAGCAWHLKKARPESRIWLTSAGFAVAALLWELYFRHVGQL